MLSLLITGGSLENRLQLALSHQTPEGYILDGQLGSISIDQVRQLERSLSLTQSSGSPQSFILLEAQSLTLPAQHAILKTLEEPQAGIQIILTVPQPELLLPTIISRCRIHHLVHHVNDLPDTTQADLKKLLQTVARSNTSQVINLAGPLAKDSPGKLLTNLETFLHRYLLDQPSAKRASILQLTHQTLLDLNANINPQLAMEHYLVELQAQML